MEGYDDHILKEVKMSSRVLKIIAKVGKYAAGAVYGTFMIASVFAEAKENGEELTVKDGLKKAGKTMLKDAIKE